MAGTEEYDEKRDLYPRPGAHAWDPPVAGDYIEDLPEHLLPGYGGVKYHQQDEVPADQLGLAGSTLWLAKTNFEEDGNDPIWEQEEMMKRPRRQSCKIQGVNNVQLNSIRCDLSQVKVKFSQM